MISLVNSTKYSLLLLFLAVGCGERTSENQSANMLEPVPLKSSGFNFHNTLRETVELNYFTYNYFYNGSGVAIGDINNDGLPDIFMVGTLVENKLFLNKGNMIFEDITEKAGVGGGNIGGMSTGATMADVNNDGWLDIYVCKSGPFEKLAQTTNLLFINNGDNTFSEKALEYGLADYGFSTMASFFDYDKDGFLDMYLLSHRIDFKYSLEDLVNKQDVWDKEASDKLFRNNGDGTFTDVSKEAGLIGDFYGYGLGVSTADLNGDGWPDIYVSNDFSGVDYYYVNLKNGAFRQEILQSMKHISNNGMGCDVADFNNDGFADLVQVDMTAKDHYRQKTNMGAMKPEQFQYLTENGLHYQYMLNSLQLNNRNGTFSEIGQLAGIATTDWSWASIFADLDNDGWKDLYVTNGLKRDMRNNDMLQTTNPKYVQGFGDENVLQALEQVPAVKLPNPVFRNNHDLTFSDVTSAWGADVPMNSNGAAIADLDLDGDLDIVVNNIDDFAVIFRNNANVITKNNFLKLKLNGDNKNPFAIGAIVTLKTGNDLQYQELQNARGYQSSSDYILHFGIGDKTLVDEIKINWNDDKISLLKNVKANQTIIADHKDAKEDDQKRQPQTTPIFKDITASSGIGYRHIENEFDDFAREILLPHKMSTNGPYVAVGDVNNDGLDDFFAGGAKNQSGELYLQNVDATFSKSSVQPWEKDKISEDIGALFFDADGDNDLDLYVCSGGNEFDPDDPNLQDRLYLNDGKGNFTKTKNKLPVLLTSTSCVVAADYDNDGDLDLFVGGRQVPGRYPFPARSYILKNDNGTFSDVTSEIAPELETPGMVTQAVWTDFDADGLIDLVIVGEWMPVSLFRNNNGRFENITETAGMDYSTGLWFSITAADFDADGDVDFVAGNLGKNTKYKASKEAPFEVYCTDFDNNGTFDIVLGKYEKGVCYPVRGRECSSQQMPFIKNKFPTFNEFAKADIETVYGEASLEKALSYQVYELTTSFIENKGNGQFEMKTLPVEVQFAPVFALLTGDFNQDGHLDILASGNLYGAEVETTRYDASVGTLLLGDGNNNFIPAHCTESGFFVNGDSRGSASIKIGKDQRPGVIVMNNNDKLQIFITNRITN